MIVQARRLTRPSRREEKALAAAQNVPSTRRKPANDHRAFIEASLSNHRRTSITARRLSNMLESLCFLSPEQRRGFIVAAADKVEYLNSAH